MCHRPGLPYTLLTTWPARPRSLLRWPTFPLLRQALRLCDYEQGLQRQPAAEHPAPVHPDRPRAAPVPDRCGTRRANGGRSRDRRLRERHCGPDRLQGRRRGPVQERRLLLGPRQPKPCQPALVLSPDGPAASADPTAAPGQVRRPPWHGHRWLRRLFFSVRPRQ